MFDVVFLVVEEGKKLLCIFVDVFRLLKEAGAEKIVEDLPEFRMIFKIFDVFLFDGLLDSSKVGLEFGIKIFFTLLHMKIYTSYI